MAGLQSSLSAEQERLKLRIFITWGEESNFLLVMMLSKLLLIADFEILVYAFTYSNSQSPSLKKEIHVDVIPQKQGPLPTDHSKLRYLSTYHRDILIPVIR